MEQIGRETQAAGTWGYMHPELTFCSLLHQATPSSAASSWSSVGFWWANLSVSTWKWFFFFPYLVLYGSKLKAICHVMHQLMLSQYSSATWKKDLSDSLPGWSAFYASRSHHFFEDSLYSLKGDWFLLNWRKRLFSDIFLLKFALKFLLPKT